MFKSRFLLGLSIISLVLVSLAFSSFRNNAPLANRDAASDFAQRHPNWNWVAAAPIASYSDYYQRHPNQTNLAVQGPDTSDYALRHPELRVLAGAASIDLTDYYFRHLSQ